MSDNIQTADTDESGLIAYMFTNHREQAPMIQSLLDMFYKGAYNNTIGIMSALNKDTDNEELLIVGVTQLENGLTDTYPLARILSPLEVARYVGPDGKGGWLTEDEEEGDEPDSIN